jgi:hypothetical protein
LVRESDLVTNLFNRLGSIGVLLIAGALIVGGLAGAAVASHYERLSTQSAASQQQADQQGSTQGQQGDPGDNQGAAGDQQGEHSDKDSPTKKPTPKTSTPPTKAKATPTASPKAKPSGSPKPSPETS